MRVNPHLPVPRIRSSLRSPHLVFCIFALAAAWSVQGQEVVLQFDQEPVGKPVPAYTNNGVVFAPARAGTRSTAVPRVMFFPHLKTGKKGILNAMAEDPIPVKVQFPNGASSVTLVLWGSTGCPARLEAFDAGGKVVDQASVAAVPARTSPSDPVPSFELTVKSSDIASICFSGPRAGEYLAAEEVRFTQVNGTNPGAPGNPKN
jgi:hypothetical protein